MQIFAVVISDFEVDLPQRLSSATTQRGGDES